LAVCALLLALPSCRPIASLQYGGGEYEMTCQDVPDEMVGGEIDVTTSIVEIRSAYRIDGIPPTRAFAVELSNGCGSNDPSRVLALARCSSHEGC
jgi:hypothetical protein